MAQRPGGKKWDYVLYILEVQCLKLDCDKFKKIDTI